ncbi:hypothetical protein TWF281_010741 [Arthrobotrys megalospora]
MYPDPDLPSGHGDGQVQTREPTAEERKDIAHGRYLIFEANIETDGEMHPAFTSGPGMPRALLLSGVSKDLRFKRRLRIQASMPTAQSHKGIAFIDLEEESVGDAPGARVSHEQNPLKPNRITVHASFVCSKIFIPPGTRTLPPNDVYEFFDLIQSQISCDTRTNLQLVCPARPGLIYVVEHFSELVPITKCMTHLPKGYQ